MEPEINEKAQVPPDLSGKRLDQVAAKMFPDYSRARLQTWIKDGSLLVNGEIRRPRDKVIEGDDVAVRAVLQPEQRWVSEPLPVDIVFEDESLLVINKPNSTVVHPAAGHHDGTLLNGLLHHCSQLELLPRAGIVHRLDKNTTGLLVVAKTLKAHTSLVQQLQEREVSRIYEAVTNGVLTAGGTINLPLGRHRVNRKKRAVVDDGQDAITHFTVIKRFQAHTHIQVKLETGRTHQIRVHFAHQRYPLVGDKTYGGRLRIYKGCSEELAEHLRAFPRQALHARSLGLTHPESGEAMQWTAQLPVDMTDLLTALAKDC
jgi:23S rRNA pseudouridine1911/1915/1917 synthase